MPIRSEPYYWLECDCCGARAEYGDFTAMSDQAGAIDGAYDWTSRAGKFHCETCPPLDTEAGDG